MSCLGSVELNTFGRLSSGDESALAELVLLLMPTVKRRVRREVRGRGTRACAAEDLVQDVWLALLENDARHLKSFDPSRGISLRGYVGMLVAREVGNRLQKDRAQKRGGGIEHTHQVVEDAPASSSTPETIAVARSSLAKIESDVLHRQSQRARSVFTFVFLDGWTAGEVAGRTGMSKQAIYNCIMRMRRAAEDCLN